MSVVMQSRGKHNKKKQKEESETNQSHARDDAATGTLAAQACLRQCVLLWHTKTPHRTRRHERVGGHVVLIPFDLQTARQKRYSALSAQCLAQLPALVASMYICGVHTHCCSHNSSIAYASRLTPPWQSSTIAADVSSTRFSSLLPAHRRISLMYRYACPARDGVA